MNDRNRRTDTNHTRKYSLMAAQERSTSTSLPQNYKIIERLFVRMQSIYGEQWSSRYRSDNMLNAAKIEWAYDLINYSATDIGKAIKKMKREYVEWPPSLPQFCELLRSICDSSDELKMISTPRADKDKALLHISKIKEKLLRR